MNKLRNKRKTGWMIATRYKYGKEYLLDPIGEIHSDGSYSGGTYIYHSKAGAENNLRKLGRHFEGVIIKVRMELENE